MSFFNIFNELISQESILEDLIGYYQELHDEGKTEVTDFSEGSEVRTLLEVLSHLGYNLLEETNNTLKNHFISTAEGEYLDLLGANPNINLTREQGSTATGLVKFSLANPTEEAINQEQLIPAGAMVSNDECSYETDADAVIGFGETETYAQVTCTIDGVDGNCKANTITNINDLNGDFSLNCTNEEAFVNGFDYEDDEEYRTRLLEFVRADNFGSRGYYENLLLNIENMHDVKRFGSELDAPTIAYYINTNQGSDADDEAYMKAISLLANPENVVVGHKFQLHKPTYLDVNILVDINSNCGISQEDLVDIIRTYFAGGECSNYPFFFNGFNMGETVTADKVIKNIKYLDDNITYLDIHISDDTKLTDYQVYNINNVEVTYV